MGDATTRAIERMKVAAEKALREADAQKNYGRESFCEGQASGLRAAIRMLEEEERVADAEASRADPLTAAMARAPEVEWLTPEQLAESSKALERLRTGRARIIRDTDRADVLAEIERDGTSKTPDTDQ